MESLINDFDEKQIEDIAFEYGRVMEWFRKQYPEGDIRLDVNADRTKGTLKYKLSVMTGKEMADNQGFFVSEIPITWKNFTDFIWMDNFKRSIYPSYKWSIEKAINNHYEQNKGVVN